MTNVKTKRIHVFVRAYDKYRVIEDDRDLLKEHLTLADYRVIHDCLQFLSDMEDKIYRTISKGAADWFTNNGFNVVENKDGINYNISII